MWVCTLCTAQGYLVGGDEWRGGLKTICPLCFTASPDVGLLREEAFKCHLNYPGWEEAFFICSKSPCKLEAALLYPREELVDSLWDGECVVPRATPKKSRG